MWVGLGVNDRAPLAGALPVPKLGRCGATRRPRRSGGTLAEKQGVWIMEKTLATPVIEDGLLTSVTLAHNGAGRVAHLAEAIELAVRTDHDTTRGYALNN